MWLYFEGMRKTFSFQHLILYDCISLPVCVKSFGDASSWDAESRLCICVYSGKRRHSLHLYPAKLLQSAGTRRQQGRSDQVPQRITLIGKINWYLDTSVTEAKNKKQNPNRWVMLVRVLPLQLLVVPQVGMTAGQNYRPGEATGFDPGHELLTKLFRPCLQLKQSLEQ